MSPSLPKTSRRGPQALIEVLKCIIYTFNVLPARTSPVKSSFRRLRPIAEASPLQLSPRPRTAYCVFCADCSFPLLPVNEQV